MRTFIRSLIGTVFLLFLASLVSHVGAVTAAAHGGAEGASGVLIQTDFGDALAEYSSDTSVPIDSGFWASADEDTSALWLEVPNRYVHSLGFYLAGADQRETVRWPGRTDSPFELNDIQRHPGHDTVKYVTVTGVKPRLSTNFSLDRSTREGWAINGNVVGTLPEPGTLLLMGLGLLGLGLARRRAAKKAA